MNAILNKKIDKEIIDIWVDLLLKENPMLISKLKKLRIENTTPRELLTEVIKFMSLVSVFKIKLVPSLIVDLTWHEFILFTKTYEKFCRLKLKKFIHHTPEETKNTYNNKGYQRTIHHYIILFGKPPENIWGKLAKEEWTDFQCGSCKT